MPFGDLLPVALRAERWLLPGACLLCQAAVDGGADPLVCPLCCSRFRRLPDPQCRRCGQPTTSDEPCRVCAAWPAGLSSVRSAVWLDDSARQAAHHLKYGGWSRVAESLAPLMAQTRAWDRRGWLVPVPLGRRRLRRRGYNQAEALARALAAATGLRFRGDLLRRTRDTGTQTALAPEARQANVAEAFVAGPARGARVVLVDDVFTTGATLVEAARALLQGGAADVEAVTFARAVPPIG